VESTYESQKEYFENIDSIVFSADITNEEAWTLQLLKEQHGKHLICPEAKGYQDFLKAYSSSSGYHVFKGDIETLAASDVVISFGVWFQDKSTEYIPLIQKVIDEKKPKFVYMHPIEDAKIQTSVTQFIKYEVGSEEGVAALLADAFLNNKELPDDIEDILEDLDIGYLSAESNVGEEELEVMNSLIGGTSTVSLLIGSDLYTHPKAGQIAKLIALLEAYTGVNILCIPPAKNALGVALICELDGVAQGRTGTYESCHEGTYVNGDTCLTLSEGMQTSSVDGLNSLAKTLGVAVQKLIDYTNQLPQNKGFQIVSEDDLKKPCIYRVKHQEEIRDFTLDEIDDLPVYDGALIYTYKAEKLVDQPREIEKILSGSEQFSIATKLQDGDLISFEIEGVKFVRVFKIDTSMKGIIALNPTYEIDLSTSLLSSYRFSRLAFEKINNQKIGNNDE
jgi:NADH-quinone oxidoreductase subunit G